MCFNLFFFPTEEPQACSETVAAAPAGHMWLEADLMQSGPREPESLSLLFNGTVCSRKILPR